MKTLLVDDNLEDLNTLTQKLIGLGLKVESANDIQRARRLFNNSPIDINLLITEIVFQKGDGYSLIKWMRKKNPNLQFIIITSNADLTSAISAIKLGVVDYIEKPATMKELQDSIFKFHNLFNGMNMRKIFEIKPSFKKSVLKNWRPKWHHDLVKLIVECVKYWVYSTNTNKGELAKKSGLWSTQIERNSIRARTLDRYTSIESLPQHPNWSKVLETARFVLRHCPPSSNRFEIEILLYRLQRVMNSEQNTFPQTPPSGEIPNEPEELNLKL